MKKSEQIKPSYNNRLPWKLNISLMNNEACVFGRKLYTIYIVLGFLAFSIPFNAEGSIHTEQYQGKEEIGKELCSFNQNDTNTIDGVFYFEHIAVSSFSEMHFIYEFDAFTQTTTEEDRNVSKIIHSYRFDKTVGDDIVTNSEIKITRLFAPKYSVVDRGRSGSNDETTTTTDQSINSQTKRISI